MNINPTIKYITPFILLSILAIFSFIYFLVTKKQQPEEMGFVFSGVLLAAIGIMLAVDFLLKRMLKLKLYRIWIIETILISGLVYWWIVS